MSFKRMADLTTHKKFHLIDLPHKCHLCVMAFGTSSELAIHEKLHSSLLRNGANHTAALPGSGAHKEQVALSNGQPSVQGGISDQTLNLGQGLKMAQIAITNDKVASAEDSGKLNSAEPDLDMDKLMKIVNKPFKCSQCGIAFVSTTELAGHVRIHTGQRPFKCTQCENCYRTQSTLAVHMKSHAKEKRYKCSYCEVTSPTLSKLYDHYILHQNDHTLERPRGGAEEPMIVDDDEMLPFRCWVCQRRFAEQMDLDLHISSHRDRSSTLESCVKRLKSAITAK